MGLQLKKSTIILLFAIITSIIIYAIGTAAAPTGATLVTGQPQTKGTVAPASNVAQGGNITEMNVSADAQTNVWQGYYGEVSGSIVLDDASGDRLYRFGNVTNTTGEVYASRSSSVNFLTVVGNNNCTVDEDLTGTGTDRVNNTFRQSNSTPFMVGAVNIGINTACTANTNIVNATQTTFFEENILNDTTNSVSIYVARLENNRAGFDNRTHDYQMIVPENQSSATTTYFFYLEFG